MNGLCPCPRAYGTHWTHQLYLARSPPPNSGSHVARWGRTCQNSISAGIRYTTKITAPSSSRVRRAVATSRRLGAAAPATVAVAIRGRLAAGRRCSGDGGHERAGEVLHLVGGGGALARLGE